jgi:hypothetical protein
MALLIASANNSHRNTYTDRLKTYHFFINLLHSVPKTIDINHSELNQKWSAGSAHPTRLQNTVFPIVVLTSS